ncbi:MAG TPA: EamA family transporter [Thermoplasmata archaeon]|nr:EamA family transporter [Thermoplasmata archaeon]
MNSSLTSSNHSEGTAKEFGLPTGQSNRSREPDLLFVLLLGIVWGSTFPVIRAGIVAGAPPLLFASVRYLLTAAVLVPLAFLFRTPRPAPGTLWSPALFGGLFVVAGYGGLLYLGEVTTSGGLAAVLTASAPLASALFGIFLLPTEKLGRWGTGGLLVGFCGVGVLVLPQLAHPFSAGFVGPALVVAAVLVFAIGSVLLRRTSTGTPSLWTLALQFAIAGLVVGAASLAAREPLGLGHGLTVPLALVYLVFLPGVLGYTLYFRIHHRSGPTRANLVGYINPVTGVLVGLLVFGEAVTGFELGGMALIALGLFLVQKDHARPGSAQTRKEGGASVTPTPPSLRVRNRGP